MEQDLKTKLGIKDYICRGSASDVPDLCETYYLTITRVQKGLSAK
jgi:hypothetical protein